MRAPAHPRARTHMCCAPAPRALAQRTTRARAVAAAARSSVPRGSDARRRAAPLQRQHAVHTPAACQRRMPITPAPACSHTRCVQPGAGERRRRGHTGHPGTARAVARVVALGRRASAPACRLSRASGAMCAIMQFLVTAVVCAFSRRRSRAAQTPPWEMQALTTTMLIDMVSCGRGIWSTRALSKSSAGEGLCGATGAAMLCIT